MLDAIFADAGVSVTPAIDTDTVSVLYAHVGTHKWSTVIAHAWLYLFGVPDGCAWCPWSDLGAPPRSDWCLRTAIPSPILAGALLDVSHRVDVGGVLDRLLRQHLG